MDGKRPFRSLAVMPIDTVDPSRDDEMLALRATRDLTAAAGRVLYDGLVVSSGLVQQYGKKSRDPRQIGSDLNVRYLTEGTLTQTADGHELAVTLIDTESGAQLSRTAQRFGGTEPAEAAARIANALRHPIGQNIEQEIRSLPKQQRAAWEIYMRTSDLGYSPAEMRQKQQLYEEALRIDPNFAPALMQLSLALFLRTQNEPEQHEELVRRFDQVTLRATEIAPKHPRGWVFRSVALRLQGNWGGAFAALDEALRIDPFRARTQMHHGVLLMYTGKSEDALPLLARALELDPADKEPVLWQCLALSLLERDTEAVRPCEAAAADFSYWGMNAWMTAAYANVGEANKATVWAHKTLEANPTLTIARWRSIRSSDNPVYVRQLEHVTAGLRKAGIPEQ
jgi:tetratricopeptide (TPR) repeat protein